MSYDSKLVRTKSSSVMSSVDLPTGNRLSGAPPFRVATSIALRMHHSLRNRAPQKGSARWLSLGLAQCDDLDRLSKPEGAASSRIQNAKPTAKDQMVGTRAVELVRARAQGSRRQSGRLGLRSDDWAHAKESRVATSGRFRDMCPESPVNFVSI